VVPSPKLLTLIRELQQANTPLDRLRHLALAWRTVRELSADERADLAIALGVDEAHDLVEGLAQRRGGVAPTTLLEAVESARRAEPGKLRELLAEVRTPERRAGLLERGLAAAQAALSPPASSPTPDDADNRSTGDETSDELLAADEIPRTEKTPPAAEPPAAPPPPPQAAPDPTPPHSESGAGDTSPRHARSSTVRHRPPTPKPTQLERHPPVRHTGSATRRPQPRRDRTPSAKPSNRTSLVEQILDSDRPLLQLRRVSEGESSLVASPPVELEELIGALPDGWVRRRAISRLIEAGLDTGTALHLVATMAASANRRWCLATLMRRSKLTPSDLDRVLDLVESEGQRRSLTRLARRHVR